jgi:hypothetical protein
MNLPGILILIVLLLGGLAIAGFFLWRFDRWDSGFGQIHVGDSRERVLQIMGTPTEDTDATIGIYGSKRLATNLVQGCTEQYWYYPFFTPECWWIAFDAQNHVIATYHYISP